MEIVLGTCSGSLSPSNLTNGLTAVIVGAVVGAILSNTGATPLGFLITLGIVLVLYPRCVCSPSDGRQALHEWTLIFFNENPLPFSYCKGYLHSPRNR